MKHDRLMVLAGCIALAIVTSACGGGGDGETGSWTHAEATIDGRTYPLTQVSMALEFGEDGYYQISADPKKDLDEDCVPGLGGGMFLYGPLPESARKPTDLIGERMRLEFSGDGDDANLCFVGTGGLLGASQAWVKIKSVLDDRVDFEMGGDFVLYDGESRSSRPSSASANGTAQITDIW